MSTEKLCKQFMFSISYKEQFLRLKESARGIFTTGPSFSKAGRITLSTGWINHYPADSAIGFPTTYSLDSDLSGEYCYPAFEQLEPGLFLLPDSATYIRFYFKKLFLTFANQVLRNGLQYMAYNLQQLVSKSRTQTTHREMPL